MDRGESTLGAMVLDEITPVVMVLRTPGVEESCRKSHLSFIQMLTPFCDFHNIDVPVRTANDLPYRLRRFKLRLFYASDIRQPDVEVAKERLRQVITRAGEEDMDDLSSDPPEIESVLATSELECMPSWFQFFNKELVRTVSFSDHEAFDHPVACILAVSSKDEDPINKFIDLFNTSQLPSLLNDGAMDPKILKQYILVHDNLEGSSEKAAKILAQMKSTFGPTDCQLLCINSSEDGFPQSQDNPWGSHQTDSSQSQHSGCFLSLEDVDELKTSMKDLTSKQIIPHMEQKIRVLNQQVSATRRGLRNQIKNLWWRKGKDDPPDNPTGSTYTFSSSESQIRVLGDYAFMLRDYELALSNYRLLSTDFKLDKAWKRYAGVQEMMGLAYFMLDQSRKDAENCMENAFSTYLKIGSSGQRNATRCGLWWVEMLKASDQYKEAANVYFRITGEAPLHLAVMLEQASYCYLLSAPPMIRKYGFHLVLSGDLYKKCDQIKHAIRTYRSALSVFKGTTWSHIRDHVNFHIGKWYAALGMFDVAVKHMFEVLSCGHQSKATQELFLRDFFQIVKKTGKPFEVCKLQLPVINFSSLNVTFEDHRTYASPSAVNVKETLWNSLEEEMVPSLTSTKTNWLDLQSKILPKKYRESNISVAGESIRVNVEFRNPLQILVSVSSVSLICEHSVGSDTEVDSTSSLHQQSGEQLTDPNSSRKFSSGSSSLSLSEVDVFLKGGESLVVQLTVTPKVEGTLNIVGVKWKLSDYVSGFCNFEPEFVKKRAPKGRRRSKRSTFNNLKFLVIKSLPKVTGFLRDLPNTVYVGELQRLAIELRNPSEIPVKILKMRVSSPRFLNIGDREVLDMDFPSCLEKGLNTAENNKSAEARKTLDSLFLFPENTRISGEVPLCWPLWFRAATPGKVSLYISVYYEMDDVSSVMGYRTLRMHYNLEVLPSLDVSFHISPRPSKFQEFLLRMDVVNRTSSESFQVHQLSSAGEHWELSLLQPIDTSFHMEYLGAGQALSCFFKLQNCRTLVSAEKSPSEKAYVRLSLENSGALLDIHSSPLVVFHHQERSHQEVSDKDHQGSVDFILVSHKKDGSGKVPYSIFSHHACHCSLSSTSPIWWIMDGPRTVKHNFFTSLCEIQLRMTIYNSSDMIISVDVDTVDSITTPSSSISSASQNETGWHDLTVNDNKITTDIVGPRAGKSISPASVPPYIWSGLSSTRFKLKPLSSTEIPLCVSVFAPGTYDLSNYSLRWNLVYPNDQVDNAAALRSSSGTCSGHSYYVTVLQQE
ncbi:hypothetical protein LIER_03102 [Lithospermum erythrorhizon]|uniref:Trafficking protein particle complex subunit 8 n=1 Tax=Lithospermum erythrorhizon TaxID=34254 RepID=A0AAV3NT79_LITER